MRTHRILVSRLCFQAARVPSDQAGCRRSSAEESATCEWGLGHPARRLGHFTAASSVQRDGRLELIMQSMACGLMECLEGIRNPCKCLKKWSGRPDSNRRRPAWEVGQCFVFSNITAHGVDSGYQERQQNTISFRLAC